MSDHKITTLSEFLHQSGAKYRVFDMGRRVCKLSPDDFVSFEWARKPYPYPFQRSALFGVIFWHPDAAEKQYVWFLKFPLDEQGLLIQAARDEFLLMLLDRVGECMLAAADGQQIEGALKDSLYTFTPREDKMAAFNAHATKSLALKPSQFYHEAYAYFTGKRDLDSWQSLAMQGVADVAVRLDDNEETLGLIETLPRVPAEPFNVLSTFLENAAPAAGIVEILVHRVNVQLQEKQPDISMICACLRAASNSPAKGLVDQMTAHVLKHRCSQNIEILAIICGRLWPVLKQVSLCKLFVEQLAHNDTGYSGFSQLLADLMFIPGMREPVMQALRDPKRSEKLSRYVGRMFG
ncbi:DUF3549 family protein [Methylophaga sp. OBS4]|uniref:DUF3549 family protein n=1 Tax=Methylophaga sp. OBS4 TaxID=2991935 RepID=UPI00224DFF83|nr:DUF3549 family protein [Methylophaga sp. OBS4]MCX4187899.1 DUF3549 family protein [Methylophaga sp. OBS4]